MALPRLFLVDDEREFCADLEAVLADRYEILLAHDEETAQAGIASLEPDVVLLDVDLGTGQPDGVRLLERIRREIWRGNVRELRNFVERAVINCCGGLVGLGDMFGAEPGSTPLDDVVRESVSLQTAADNAKAERERLYCRNRLRETAGNVSRAAELSGVPRQSFQRKLRVLGVDPAEFKDPAGSGRAGSKPRQACGSRED